MTAVDIQQEGIHWTHALELLPVLPFLKHLEIPIVTTAVRQWSA